MKVLNIKDKLAEIGIDHTNVVLGDYDYIGEFTAKRTRNPSDPNYKKYGFTYKSNYERAILICSLIQVYNLQSFIEVGFGRGYTSFCVAKTFHDLGVKGQITTIDPNFNEEHLNSLTRVFPKDWFDMIKFTKGTSQDVLPKLNDNFDFAYIDGDHSYEATKSDWENCLKKNPSVVLFDDYHLSTKNDPGIQCARAIDEIDWESLGFVEPQLIISDRRLFFDDRQFTDDQIDYGQLLLVKKELAEKLNEW